MAWFVDPQALHQAGGVAALTMARGSQSSAAMLQSTARMKGI